MLRPYVYRAKSFRAALGGSHDPVAGSKILAKRRREKNRKLTQSLNEDLLQVIRYLS